MKRFKLIFITVMGLIFISSPYFLSAQNKPIPFYDGSKKFSITMYGTYVSSAELLDNISSPIPLIRDASVELAGGYGYGGEIIYSPNFYDLGIKFYLSSEYLKVKDDGLAIRLTNDSMSTEIGFTEEFSMIPIEAGLKWNLPVSTERFKIYIGGGAGVYFGKRTRSYGLTATTNISTSPGFSMNVLSGIQYYVGRNISLDFQFKFREGAFDSRDNFTQDSIKIDGLNYPTGNPVISRIVVDGVRLSAGIKYDF